MSLFIDQASQFFYHLYSTSPHRLTKESQSSISGQSNTFETVLNNLGSMSEHLFEVIETDRSLSLSLDFTKLNKRLSCILSVMIDKKTRDCQASLRCLDHYDSYMMVTGRQRMKIICKWLTSQFYVSQFNLVIDLSNGQVRIKIPLLYRLSRGDNNRDLELLIKNIKARLMQSVEMIHHSIQIVMGMCNRNAAYSVMEKALLNRQNFGFLYWLNKYINAYVYISCQQTHQEKYMQQQMKKQMQSIEYIRQHFVPFQQEIQSIMFYETNSHLTTKTQVQDLRVESFDKKKMRPRIQMPAIQKSSKPQENGYVLNFIKTKKPLKEYPMKYLCQGGFTSIRVTQVDYWYISSSNVGSAKINEQIEGVEPIKKRLIIKRQSKKKIEKCGKSRIQHERFILSRIKNGLSIFLPQYYLLAEKDDDNEKGLMADFINYPNLYEYCNQNKMATSFHTKIYFSILIAQGLRYLKEYNVAHLDLKPANIMTNRKLNLKLIDFGESYHPQLLSHEPGFTMPYSAPQNYKGCQSYNYKNDVFSLGIIMHELFMGRYPFYFHNADLQKKVYTSETYGKYWFHTSEENNMNGEGVVFPLVESIIMKCLHPDPRQRPELEWIVYILRGCLDYFY